MSVTLNLTPDGLSERLKEQAARLGEKPGQYAETVARSLEEAARRAEGITDEQARDLLLGSALENVLPRVLEENGRDSLQLSLLLLLVLGAAVVLRGRGEEEMRRSVVTEAWAQAGQDATADARAALHKHGIGFVVGRNGAVVEELPDGTVRPLVPNAE